MLLVMAGIAARPVWAQPGAAVQLPTYSFFTVNTTVLVPDGGSAYMGGVSRSQAGRSEYGSPLLPLRNVGIGSNTSASSVRVTATIHDFEAMDEALLGEPASSFAQNHRGLGPASQQRSPVALAGNWMPKTTEEQAGPTDAIAEAKAGRVAAQQTRSDEAERFFQRAKAAESEGKTNVARIYYQMVARRGSGELKEQALARIDSIDNARTVRVAQSRP